MEELGYIGKPDGARGWHVVLFVLYPGAQKKKRERITWAEGLGRIRTEAEAKRVLGRIRSQTHDRPLHEVVRDYLRGDTPENLLLARFESEWLPEVRRRLRTGEIVKGRAEAFERMQLRGYLAFWEHHSIYEATDGEIVRWLGWVRDRFPHLEPVTLRHIVRDFGTFLRFEKTLGTLKDNPNLPAIKVPKKPRRVPGRESLARILACIPEERRGLWLARALAGLRPAEARQANVSHYQDGVIRLTPEIVKTRDARDLVVRIVAPELDAWIRRHRVGAKPWQPLFPNPSALNDLKRWSYNAEWKCWAAACAAAGVEYVKPNWGGRHAFATHEAKAGANLKALQEWMGHSQFSTTEKYIDEFEAIELARVLRPQLPSNSPANHSGMRNVASARRNLVGDTGFEPVTPTV